MSPEIPEFTPVNLITGFLGSGKTTLLNRLLADPRLADTAVMVNEFGEVGLDHHLLERIDERTVLLQSGCLCCTIRGELAEAIKDLHSRRTRGVVPPFRRLAIESTGLADPFPVLTTIHAEPVIKHHFRMSNVITTIDAVNGARHLARYSESVKQLAAADRVVLTKTDIAEPAEAARLVERIRAINPTALLLRAAEDTFDAETLLGGDAYDLARKSEAAQIWFAAELREAEEDHDHGAHDASDPSRHGKDIEAFALTFDTQLDWVSFGVWLTMLLNRHGEKILRVKGILHIAGTETPVAIHGVQYLVHPPVHLRSWPDEDRRSRLVFILQGLNRRDIECSLAIFLGVRAHRAEAVAYDEA